jgi:hypothetical protein
MTKPAVRQDKYFLRDLHQEIDLYDRKLAFLNQYMDFASPADRQEAANRLLAKRALLEKKARALVAMGVEYRQEELPRSFRARPDLELVREERPAS